MFTVFGIVWALAVNVVNLFISDVHLFFLCHSMDSSSLRQRCGLILLFLAYLAHLRSLYSKKIFLPFVVKLHICICFMTWNKTILISCFVKFDCIPKCVLCMVDFNPIKIVDDSCTIHFDWIQESKTNIFPFQNCKAIF